MIRKTLMLTLIGSSFFYAHADFNPQQKKDIQSVIKEYLVNTPEILEEAMTALQAKRQKEKETNATAIILKKQKELFQSATDPILGNPKGTKEIVVFLDPFCGHCRRFHEVLDKAVKNNSDLRVVVKDLPVLGEPSAMAVMALLTAHLQGEQAYDALQSKIMEAEAPLSKDDFIKIASQISGIDTKKFAKDVDSDQVSSQMKATLALAQEIGVNGTPSLIIGNNFIEGGMSYEDLMKALGK